MSECHPDDLEVIRGGVFGQIVEQDVGKWQFCGNNGGYTAMNDCFEGLKQDRICWMIPDKIVFCVAN